MPVKVINQKTGEETIGKFASFKDDQLNLYTGITSNKKGGWRGCGKRFVFVAEEVTVSADEPDKELRK